MESHQYLDAEARALIGLPPLGDSPPATGESIPAIATTAELCALMGVSDNRGRDLADRGIFVRTGRNRFDTRESIRNFFLDLQKQAKRPGVGSELDREKVRVQRETADKLTHANALARGELLSAKTVATEWARILHDLRAAMLAIPQRVAGRCSLDRLTVQTIDEEIRMALEATADGA